MTTDNTTATAADPPPFRFFDARVLHVRRLSPSLTRVTFGGPGLAGFRSGGHDQSFSLFLPPPGRTVPDVPGRDGDGWFHAWRAQDPAERAIMRSYTVRAQRTGAGGHPELDVDFALHGDVGPASRWAAGAAPDDRVLLLGPAVEDNRSVGFRPPPDTDWVLLAADETALPAVGGILDRLPPGLPALLWLEVPHEQDRQALPLPPHAHAHWFTHGGDPARRGRLTRAVAGAELPTGPCYAWLAGEAGGVRALRRHLVHERGLDRRRVTFSGYWRLGASEEQLRQEALDG
ncbi:siderophore-interacting protein [Streptomyces durbertensis]|uniref:Siderophore-interacting protein n=1 Tax=Streptomyces durbertensis TaxID=2448886 RepID=A0ABR6EJI7_9ACTN|nr:SIP domain-containing protein [Streptomyces durbertensis]MBB1245506.1 siderophore-interacting protein [Streptomyces durbertensis]